jgi:hypothetical protein
MGLFDFIKGAGKKIFNKGDGAADSAARIGTVLAKAANLVGGVGKYPVLRCPGNSESQGDG